MTEYRVISGVIILLAALVPVYLLYKLMGPISAKVNYKAGQIGVQLGGPVAVYIILVWRLWSLLPAPPPPCYEAWKVKGQLVLQDPKEPIDDTDISVVPSPSVIEKKDGFFIIDLVAKPNSAGQRELPNLLLWHKGYESINIPLVSGTYGPKDRPVRVKIDKENKVVDLGQVTLQQRAK
jgi:hypothetical protein